MASSDSESCGSDLFGVEVGFVQNIEKEEAWKLHRCYFPSKVGGKPAWLDPKNLPATEDQKCISCGKPLVFLLQVYAPNEDNDNAFHRTVYIFCCKNENCYEPNSSKPFRVIRCQLKRENDFYNPTAPQYESSTFSQSCKEYQNTCQTCGCRGDKMCARCHRTSYCSKEHQALDWKYHKPVCGKDENDLQANHSSLLFPENEIIMESEESHHLPDDARSTETSSSQSGKIIDGSFSPSELEEFANFNDGDKQFLVFRKIISRSIDQVLRYDKGGTPLWCTSENQLSAEEVPKCHCGAPRQFEFQVMPQLLNHLSVHTTLQGPSIDWGILAVYTCSMDCSTPGNAYENEFLYKQDFSTTNMH